MNRKTFWQVLGEGIRFVFYGIFSLIISLMCFVPFLNVIVNGKTENGNDTIVIDYILYSLLIVPSIAMIYFSYASFRHFFKILFNKEERKDLNL